MGRVLRVRVHARRAEDPTINLSGVIFDSAPAAITAVSGAVACGKLYKQGSVASLAAYWVSYAFFALMLGITDRSAAFKDRIETSPQSARKCTCGREKTPSPTRSGWSRSSPSARARRSGRSLSALPRVRARPALQALAPGLHQGLAGLLPRQAGRDAPC